MGKSMVSCRFSLKPIHWCVQLLSMVIWKPKLRYLDLQLPQAAPLCDHHPDQLQEIIGSDGILYLRLADGNSAQVRISFVGWSLQFFQMGRYLKTRISYNFKRDNIWILRGSNLYSMVPILKIPNEHINYGCFGGSNCETAPLYSPLGNSMRSHVLLRLVGGKELWKSMRAASSLCLEKMVLIIDTFTCVFACLEFT